MRTQVSRAMRQLRNKMRDYAGRGNVGKWTAQYRRASNIGLYGDETTYRLAAEYLSDVDMVEDWGCGLGGFRRFCKTGYIGVDGSPSPFVDKVVDLETYKSDVEGILMRHVLEHNYRWEQVLDNALASFRKRMCLILFTPFSQQETRELNYDRWIGVPDLSLTRDDIVGRFGDIRWKSQENLRTATQYSVEHIFYLSKGAPAM